MSRPVAQCRLGSITLGTHTHGVLNITTFLVNDWVYNFPSFFFLLLLLCRPYIIDLDSANGTYLNNQKIESRRFYELKEKVSIFFTSNNSIWHKQVKCERSWTGNCVSSVGCDFVANDEHLQVGILFITSVDEWRLDSCFTSSPYETSLF